MTNRRDFLQASALAACATVTSAACSAEENDGLLDAHNRATKLLRGGPLLNLERAYKVMAEEELAGLIVCLPINVLQFSGYHDHWTARIDEPSSFVLLSSDSRVPPAMVMNQFLYYYSIADGEFDWPGEVFLFTGWGSDPDGDDDIASTFKVEPEAATPFIFSDRGEQPLKSRENHRIASVEDALSKQPASAGAQWGLLNAAKALGLNKGRVGTDHPVVATIFGQADLATTTVDGKHAIRRIRMIKSEREIALMRYAAAANAQAALAAVRTVRKGATHRELRAEFYKECGKRGTLPQLLQVDSVTSEVLNEEFKEGDAFAIDAVSTGLHYTGDYGRTIFVGEPTASMKAATEAISVGWDAVREKLRPGVRYSEIRQIGRDAIKRGGFSHLVAVTPHSVGLCHTDEPGRDGPDAYWVKDDLVLEENMIISVDMPVLHSGMGGTAHLEDLTLITRDGSETINDIGDRVIVV